MYGDARCRPWVDAVTLDPAEGGRGEVSALPPSVSRRLVFVDTELWAARRLSPQLGSPRPALVLTHTLFSVSRPSLLTTLSRSLIKMLTRLFEAFFKEQSNCSDQFFTFHLLTHF